MASANLVEFIGVEASHALGLPLGEVLGTDAAARLLTGQSPRAGVDQVQTAMPQFHTVRLPPVTDGLPPDRAPAKGRERWVSFEVVTYPNGPLQIMEFEPVSTNTVSLRSLFDSIRRTLDHPRSLDGVVARCEAAAVEVRELTGYDRVLVYRLDTGGSGEVIADTHRAGLPDYSGKAFAAGAVPQARRELYEHLMIRVVTDVNDEPVLLLHAPGAAGASAAELNLSRSWLRAPSAADRHYLEGLGVGALLTVPLVIDGQLWGLLACHHQSPRRVPHDLRAACDLLGRLLSWEVRSAQLGVDSDRLSRLGGLVVGVITAMSSARFLAQAALEVPGALLGMVDADGVLLRIDGARVSAGTLPEPGDLDDLVSRVITLAGADTTLWATDVLPDRLTQAGLDPAAGGAATGVLYVPFGGGDGDYALWVRGPDRSRRTPADSVTPEQADTVAERSRPWLDAERTAAETFANAMPALLLHRAHLVLIEQELAATAERARLEHQLHQNQRLESLGQLAGGVAHDFNNLLAVILNYAEFVSDEIDAEAGATSGSRWTAVQGDIHQIKTATRRAADLTHQLLAFARREVVAPEVLDLNAVIDSLTDILQRTLGEHVELVTGLDAGLDPIRADRGQLDQVLVNLAVNARDAMPAGGRFTIRTTRVGSVPPPLATPPPGNQRAGDDRVSNGAGDHRTGDGRVSNGAGDGRWVRLEVSDTGTGMPQAVIDHAFEPFFTTKGPGSGTGLGLATVHGIIEQAGGTIAVSSEPGAGTKFTVVFPATSEHITAAVASTATIPELSGKTVLVVDDGDELRDITRRLLIRAGYTVLSAASGTEALAVAARHHGHLDLLLTDHNMPAMTGHELAAELRIHRPDVRVLVMSGYLEPRTLTDPARPDYRVLDKPFTRTALLSAITAVLGDT